MYDASQTASTRTGSAPLGADLVALSVTIMLLNLPLLAGQVPSAFLLTSAAMSGEWWRWLTHPFVHVSLYHAALDVCAFLSLYAALPRGSRALSAGAALIGSTVAALLAGGIPVGGFCGLSGAGHGLMAALALVLLKSPNRANRRLGGATFVLVAGKVLIEALSGSVFFVSWHWGDVGSPVAVCHAGGVLGGAVAGLHRPAYRPSRY
ncbi:MAG TPA: rhomboid family intramembrane serine protease [Kiritimatiellia bacterium]|nr:rhomboid family intramembrane serine protease [Kiritimatiellia bacterium]